MLRGILIVLQFSCLTFLHGQFKVTVNIGGVPPEPKGNELYMAGSFNGWNPANENFMCQRKENGQFYIELKLAAGRYEYKVTRGGWDKVECSEKGTAVANRSLEISADTAFTVNIAGWQDNFQGKPRVSTASKNVHIIDTAFFIPQLKRTRRVWVYLPPNYSSSKNKYPVLYMHDGQNVFDDVTSFAGEWGVDEFLDSAKTKQCIVVAIDNGGGKRLNEYCPYDFSVRTSSTDSLSGKGEGVQYVDFLVKTLKPYIDRKYRTKKGRADTYIAGSSMGGLISMYAVVKYPAVFGGAGIFSPAFWVGSQIFEDIKKANFASIKPRLYFYAGGSEAQTMVPDMQKAASDFEARCQCTYNILVNNIGEHNEAAWRKEFPAFYFWVIK